MTANRRRAPMNQRRLVLLALGAGLSGNAALLQAQTPAANLRRVGVLAPSTRAKEEVILKPFFDQMRALGWIEGQTIAYDRAYADDQQETLPRLAIEMVARKPELIYAPASPTATAAKLATRTIPIVFGAVPNPVGIGLVASLARPGGNVTGISNISASLVPNRLQLLREVLPGVKRIGLLMDSTDLTTKLVQQEVASVATSLGLTMVVAECANPVEFEAAFAKLIAQGAGAIHGSGPWRPICLGD